MLPPYATASPQRETFGLEESSHPFSRFDSFRPSNRIARHSEGPSGGQQTEDISKTMTRAITQSVSRKAKVSKEEKYYADIFYVDLLCKLISV